MFFLIFLGQSGKRQSGKQDNPTNTKENPADSKHVCQIVTAVTYCLSDCHWCLSDCLSSMFAGLSSLPDFLCQIFMKIRQITHAIRQTLLVFHRCCHIYVVRIVRIVDLGPGFDSKCRRNRH